MGNIRCLNCRNEITTISGMECPHCRAQLSHVKIAFLSYLGPEDSLAGYQRSYKLVLFKSIFELIRAGQAITVSRVAEVFRQYYLDRKQAGLPADKEADIRISNVENSDLRDIWLLINMNPYAAISKHGFLKVKGDGLNGTFVLQKGIDTLTSKELDSVLNIVEKKLIRYFESIGSSALIGALVEANESPENSEQEPVVVEVPTPKVFPEMIPVQDPAPIAIDETNTVAPVEETDTEAPKTIVDASDDILLEDLPLSTRAYNAFKRSGMSNLGQLRAVYQDGSIAEIRNIGRTVIEEVGTLLASNIQARMQPTEPLAERPIPPEGATFSGEMDDDTKEMLISEVFYENAFNLFRTFCKRNDFIKVGDLIGFSFDKLQQEKGFGPGKIAKIAERWSELENGAVIANNTPDEVQEDRYLTIHSSNASLHISALQLVGGSKKVQNGLRFLEIHTLGDLANTTTNALERKFRPEQMTDLQTSLVPFTKSYHDVLEELFDAVARGESFDLFVKRVMGSTLQAVATEYNVTREWVRQICAKTERKIMPLLSPLISELTDSNGARYLREEQIREYIDNEIYASAVIHTLREGEQFESFGSPLIFFEATSFPDVKNKLAELATDIVGDGINIFESADSIESSLEAAGYGFLNADDFLGLLIVLDYKFFGDYVLKDRKSYGRLCTRIIEEHFPDGISNSKEDMALLRSLVHKEYGDLDLPDNDRAMYARICDYLILRGRSKYIAPAKVFVDEGILSEIKQFIEDSRQKDIFYSELFAEFEGLLMMMTNIDNHQFLHGVLKYYYPADYSYSRDFLSKETGEAGQSLADRITDYITSVGTALHRKDILRQFPGISEVVLFNTAYNFNGLLQWEYNYYNTLANLHLTSDDIAAIELILESLLDTNDGYCSEGMLYEKAQAELSELLEKACIKNSMNLFYTAQELFDDKYSFRNPHIARVGRFQTLTGTDIATDLISSREALSMKAFNAMADRLKWAPVSAGGIFIEITKEYIRTAQDTYIRKDKFTLTKEDVDYLKSLFEGQAEGNWYLPLQLFADSEDEIPSGLQINEFLLGSVINMEDFGWHIVAPHIKDRRYQRGILVRNEVNVNTYDQLVSAVLKENSITEMPENDLLSFLMIRSLALRYIPKDLQTSSLFRYSEGVYTIL